VECPQAPQLARDIRPERSPPFDDPARVPEELALEQSRIPEVEVVGSSVAVDGAVGAVDGAVDAVGGSSRNAAVAGNAAAAWLTSCCCCYKDRVNSAASFGGAKRDRSDGRECRFGEDSMPRRQD